MAGLFSGNEMFVWFCFFHRRRPGVIGGRIRFTDGGWHSTDGGWPMPSRSHSLAGALRGFGRIGGRQLLFLWC